MCKTTKQGQSHICWFLFSLATKATGFASTQNNLVFFLLYNSLVLSVFKNKVRLVEFVPRDYLAHRDAWNVGVEAKKRFTSGSCICRHTRRLLPAHLTH